MNYNTFMNKPTINNKEIIGNIKASDIGGLSEEEMEQLITTDLTPYYTKAQIDDLFSRSYVYREKSGSIVTFDCPSTPQNIPVVTVEIVATQSGSGDPSPTNVRPISGWSAVNVYDNGTTTPIQFVVNGETKTIYSGYVEIKNGKVKAVATQSIVDLGTRIWTYDSASQRFLTQYKQSDMKDLPARTMPLLCTGYLPISDGRPFADVPDFAIYTGTQIIVVHDSRYTDVATFTPATSGVMLLYELATPIEYDLADVSISTQDGTNNLWADSGDITVKALDKIIQG